MRQFVMYSTTERCTKAVVASLQRHTVETPPADQERWKAVVGAVKADAKASGKSLFLPTLTAIRFNPLLQGFYERLVRAGKPKMQAVGACMRKLVMLCYGVLKNRAPFDPAWASKKAS